MPGGAGLCVPVMLNGENDAGKDKKVMLYNEQNIDFEIHSNHLCELAVLVSQRSGHQEGQGKEGGSWSYHDVCCCCRFVRLPDF